MDGPPIREALNVDKVHLVQLPGKLSPRLKSGLMLRADASSMAGRG